MFSTFMFSKIPSFLRLFSQNKDNLKENDIALVFFLFIYLLTTGSKYFLRFTDNFNISGV